jgi:hypothetical protein
MKYFKIKILMTALQALRRTQKEQAVLCVAIAWWEGR